MNKMEGESRLFEREKKKKSKREKERIKKGKRVEKGREKKRKENSRAFSCNAEGECEKVLTESTN